MEEISSATDTESTVAIELHGIEKTYGPTVALKHLDLKVYGGEVLGFIGANGAGKSTTLKIIAGSTRPTKGTIFVGGEAMVSEKYVPSEAARRGVYCVHQELSLCTNLEVWENFALARQRRNGSAPRARQEEVAEAARALRSVFPTSSINPRSSVDSLTLGERQMVDVARALSHRDLRAVVLDEPTSALGSVQARELQKAVKDLRDLGVAIIYVTHKIDDLLAVAQRIAVLRGGVLQWSGSAASLSKADIVELLVGGDRHEAAVGATPGSSLTMRAAVSVPAIGAKLCSGGGLPVAEVPVRGRGGPVTSITVKTGEVVGLAGVEGAGQREVLQSVFAQVARRRRRGGTVVRGRVAYVSGDRQREGVFNLWSIRNNIIIGARRQVAPWGIIRPKKADSIAAEWFENLQVAAPSPDTPIASLSGGNQQKVLVARAFAGDVDLLLLDDPTRGVDLGTKRLIYELILQRTRASDVGVLLFSTDDSEIALCDRVYVMREGAVVQEFSGDEVSEETVGRAAYIGENGPLGQALGATP